jgi:radical SAM superfamily enzyme YgiQ (UPF0313 family)
MSRARRSSRAPSVSPRVREIGGPTPNPAADLRFALVYPNTYYVGMSNLGVHYVHQTLNSMPDTVCERFFLDHPTRSVDRDTPLERFPILLFSVSFELDYVNIVKILRRNGLPELAHQRKAHHPLLIGGGVAIGLNRLPVDKIFDAFLIGEGEQLLAPLAQSVREAGGAQLEPRLLLAAIAQLPGGEVTAGGGARFGLERSSASSASEKTEKQPGAGRWAPALAVSRPEEEQEVCASALLTPDTEFGNRALIEIARGCPHSCTFCCQGDHGASYRPRPLAGILAAIDRWRPQTKRFGLVASAVGAHPHIDDVCRHCAELDAEVSFSSLRVEDVTPTMLDSLARSGQRTLTIAPEAGSARLRKLLAKRLTDEQILTFAEDVFRRGIRNLKLYFMLGLPREELEDLEAIATLTQSLRKIMISVQRPSGQLGAITINANIFVPKPHTPLARLPLPELAQVRAHRKLLRKLLQQLPNVKLRLGSLRQARIQLVLARGDRRAEELLRALADNPSPPAQLLKASNKELDERYGLGLAE